MNAERSHSLSLSLTPKVGYFPVKYLAAGLALPATFFGQASYSTKSTSRSLGLGPFVRYYLKMDEKLFALGEVGYTWGFDRVRNSFNNDVSIDNVRLRQLRAGAGLAYFCTRNLAIELLISYQRYRDSSLTKNDGVVCEGGFQFYFGK